MSGAIPPFPLYAFMAWCSVKAQGHPFTALCVFSYSPYFSYLYLKYLIRVFAGYSMGQKVRVKSLYLTKYHVMKTSLT